MMVSSELSSKKAVTEGVITSRTLKMHCPRLSRITTPQMKTAITTVAVAVKKSHNIRVGQSAYHTAIVWLTDIEAVNAPAAHLFQGFGQRVIGPAVKRRRCHDHFKGRFKGQGGIVGPHDIRFGDHSRRVTVIVCGQYGIDLCV